MNKQKLKQGKILSLIGAGIIAISPSMARADRISPSLEQGIANKDLSIEQVEDKPILSELEEGISQLGLGLDLNGFRVEASK